MKPKLTWKAIPAWRGVDVYLYFTDGAQQAGVTASLQEVPKDMLRTFQQMADKMVRTNPAAAPYLKSVIDFERGEHEPDQTR